MAATGTVPVDPANLEQLRAWDGDEGAYWATHADRFDRSLAAHHHRLMAAAAVGPSDRVLDIGCGTGQTTRDAGRAAAAGSAVGVDLSSAMLDVARRTAAAEGLANVRFERADAQVHRFPPGGFDLALSRTGTMFFADPVAAFANVATVVRPGGRLVMLTWQGWAANEWVRELSGALSAGEHGPAPPPDARGPFSLADPARVRATLSAAGFADVEVAGSAAGMWFGADVADAHAFVLGLLGWMLDGRRDDERAAALAALDRSLAAHATPAGVVYDSAAWIVTATRP